jgi:WhiB family redox-sensing transcriptional regulator
MPFAQPWQEAAACKTLPLEMFFPPAEQEAEAAKTICSGCTVREPCLEAALAAGERFGIWGGLSSDERQKVVSRRRARAATARAAGLDVKLGAV